MATPSQADYDQFNSYVKSGNYNAATDLAKKYGYSNDDIAGAAATALGDPNQKSNALNWLNTNYSTPAPEPPPQPAQSGGTGSPRGVHVPPAPSTQANSQSGVHYPQNNGFDFNKFNSLYDSGSYKDAYSMAKGQGYSDDQIGDYLQGKYGNTSNNPGAQTTKQDFMAWVAQNYPGSGQSSPANRNTANAAPQGNYTGMINVGTATNPVTVDPINEFVRTGGLNYGGLNPTDLAAIQNYNPKPDTSGYSFNTFNTNNYQGLVDFAKRNSANAPQAVAAQTAQAPQVTATTIDTNAPGLVGTAITANVRPEDTSQYQLQKMTAQDSPLMQLAEQSGMRVAASRGLVNSSMAAGSAQSAMVQAAQPFALQDATTYANERIQNQNAQNQQTQANQQTLSQLYQANLKSQSDAALANQKATQDVNLSNTAAANDIAKLNATNQFDANSQAAQIGLDAAKTGYLTNLDYVNRAQLLGSTTQMDAQKSYIQNVLDTAKAHNANIDTVRQDYINALLTRGQNAATSSDQLYNTTQTNQQQAFNTQQLAILNGQITRENASQVFGFDLTKLKTTQDFEGYENALNRATQIKLGELDVAGKQATASASISASAMDAASRNYATDVNAGVRTQELADQREQNKIQNELNSNKLTFDFVQLNNQTRAEILKSGNGVINQMIAENMDIPVIKDWANGYYKNGLGIDNAGDKLFSGQSVDTMLTEQPLSSIPSTGTSFKTGSDLSKWLQYNDINTQKVSTMKPAERTAFVNTLISSAGNGVFNKGSPIAGGDGAAAFKMAEDFGLSRNEAQRIESAVNSAGAINSMSIH